MSARAATARPGLEEKTTDAPETEPGWKVVLFNCECHTFDEVETQLLKAIRCTLSRARQISMEVHSKGSSVVYLGPRERCDEVAMVIAEIGLVVKVVR